MYVLLWCLLVCNACWIFIHVFSKIFFIFQLLPAGNPFLPLEEDLLWHEELLLLHEEVLPEGSQILLPFLHLLPVDVLTLQFVVELILPLEEVTHHPLGEGLHPLLEAVHPIRHQGVLDHLLGTLL